MNVGLGFLWALCFAVPAALLSLIRRGSGSASSGYNSYNSYNSVGRGGTLAINLIADMILLFLLNGFVFYWVMPAMTFPKLMPLIFFNLLVVVVVAIVADFISESVGAASVLAVILFVVLSIVWISGHNSDHDPKKAATIVSVTDLADGVPPASTTSNLVTVSSDIATTKAKQAMSSGVSGQRNYNTYLNLGDATLQFVDNHMWYIFPLNFDNSRNKTALHGVEPGYLMVSAENPGAEPVEHYDGQYSMVVCKLCGQQSEPDRWAYNHGYKTVIDDPTLEIDDQGHPYWTETINTNKLGWTFQSPSALLVIDAHTGKITKYALDKAPQWIDRVYSQDRAKDIAGWYGFYGENGKNGWKAFNARTNANRLQVSGDPVLVYTGDGHPDWRMLLTSFNSDSAVSKIVIMDAHSGAMRIYIPQEPMGVEATVAAAFNNASGQGASMVKSNHYQAVGLTLHVIYGHLTWMATFEPEGDHPSFVGLGFVDAYHVSANNVVFGNSRSTALQNYQSQLSQEGNSNGNAPGQGSTDKTVKGVIAHIGWDVNSGQKSWYITLVGDPNHVYVGTASNVGPAIILAQPGDSVIVAVQAGDPKESQLTLTTFTDSRVPLSKPGG